ncbi:unnamed protein product [Closterium sp. Naga37s-1]|nr:unnamed protein product [Closterium sp. Naga37s-1]
MIHTFYLSVDLTGVHSEVRRTIILIAQRYIGCGQQFGGGTSELLSAFLARHASTDCREVTVEGVDRDGQTQVHKFQLHEESVPGYTTSSGDMQGCFTCCRSFARELVYNLELRLGDLTRLNGAKLFMPRSWPRGVEARDAECKEHLHGLIHLSGQEPGHHLACRSSDASPTHPLAAELPPPILQLTRVPATPVLRTSSLAPFLPLPPLPLPLPPTPAGGPLLARVPAFSAACRGYSQRSKPSSLPAGPPSSVEASVVSGKLSFVFRSPPPTRPRERPAEAPPRPIPPLPSSPVRLA